MSQSPGTPGTPGYSTARQLTIANLQELDRGKVALAVNQAIRQCVRDIEERPFDKTKRKVQLVIEASPILEKNTGVLDTVGIEFQVQAKLPVQRSTTYPMLARDDGVLTFQPHSPKDPRQTSFPEFEQTARGETVNTRTGEVADPVEDEDEDDDDAQPDVNQL